MASVNTLKGYAPTTKSLMEAVISNPQLLNDSSFSFLLDLSKKIVNLKIPKDDGFGDSPPPAQQSSCGHDHVHSGHDHSHPHAHSHSAPEAPPEPPSKPSKLTVVPLEIEDADKMTAESEPLPTQFVNCGDAAAEGLSDDEFTLRQDTIISSKSAAAASIESGDNASAISHLTTALKAESECNQLSALTISKRGQALLNDKRPSAALADGECAVMLNPDSARGLRLRGMCFRFLGDYGWAAIDLGLAQSIDFDDEVKTVQAFLSDAVSRMQKNEADQRIAEEDILKEKIRVRKEANDRARNAGSAPAAQQSEGDEAPAGAGGGGLPPGLAAMFANDPEMATAMQDPYVMEKMQEIMANPMSIMQHMGDPKLAPVIQKLMGLMGAGGMGGMGGMGGGGDSQGFDVVDEEESDDDNDDMPDLD